MLAHTTEALARTKKLRPLEFYLKQMSKTPKRKADDSLAVLAMFRRMAGQQTKE